MGEGSGEVRRGSSGSSPKVVGTIAEGRREYRTKVAGTIADTPGVVGKETIKGRLNRDDREGAGLLTPSLILS